ncbi:alpha/beta hydrolase [Streptomyces sp. CBMA152]|uniref:alpha/beta hydrolase n=1 Tax=Streptomyces sp. CBMA152 TaxID=1896312 RepID=UPI001660E1C1|nr:alpha/beta hydrolase [Streptomyces sp. CBMA152]MBD0744995.1 peptidase [Streptomyces sp. CBMA152]
MSKFRNAARWSLAATAGLLVAATLPLATANASTARTSGTAAQVPDRYLKQKLDWTSCVSGALECAAMSVPRDWHHADTSPAITVEVSRHRATGTGARKGVLMMAAGGPGASGLKRPAGLARDEPTLAAAYDIVGFDQRGVGGNGSTPVVCSDQATVDSFFTSGDLRDRSDQAIRQTFERARAFVRDCRRTSGDLLPYITTDQATRDMDLYRALLGVDKISYYGPSYATFLGAYYATEFPGRVERMVLDSNIDFSGDWQSFLKGQPLSFQRRYEQDFLPWLAKNDATYHQGRTPAEAKASYERLRKALHDHPLDLEGTLVTPNHLDVATTGAMYNAKDNFADFATALEVLEHPDAAPAAARKAIAEQLQHPMNAGFFADFFSVTCGDTPWDRSSRDWIRDSAKATRDYPLAGARELTFTSICAAWPHSPAPHIKVTGKNLPPVLMLNSTHDPATYYEAAVRAHRALPTSRLVTVVGGGDHGQYRNHNACVDTFVNDYFLDDKIPATDTTCAANPLPVPGN